MRAELKSRHVSCSALLPMHVLTSSVLGTCQQGACVQQGASQSVCVPNLPPPLGCSLAQHLGCGW